VYHLALPYRFKNYVQVYLLPQLLCHRSQQARSTLFPVSFSTTLLSTRDTDVLSCPILKPNIISRHIIFDKSFPFASPGSPPPDDLEILFEPSPTVSPIAAPTLLLLQISRRPQPHLVRRRRPRPCHTWPRHPHLPEPLIRFVSLYFSSFSSVSEGGSFLYYWPVGAAAE
jgi:hypothetical protein